MEASQRVDAKPGGTTAPAPVLALAKKAAQSWIAYRINGVTPSSGVLPRSVWDGVPPAQPSERMKGAALMKDLHAFSAHPQGDGWVVSVSSRDPRMQFVVVTIVRPATSPTVSEISG